MISRSDKRMVLVGTLLFLFSSVSSCAHLSEDTRSFVILAINDIYRIEGVDQGTQGGLARIRSLRKELERENPHLLLLHAGDFLYPSLLSREYNGEQMIDVMNQLDGDPQAFDEKMFVTFGNHEFDKGKMKDAASLDIRIEDSQFWWLGSDITFKKDQLNRPLVESKNLVNTAIVEIGGVRVGLFSLTTNTTQPDYVASFGIPEKEARRWTQKLRAEGAEVVVALTHQPIAQDEAVLQQLGSDGPDLIIGGHEHNKQKMQVQGRWVFKADADARTATIVRVTLPRTGPLAIEGTFRNLGPDEPKPDTTVQQKVQQWITRHKNDFCGTRNLDQNCLDEGLGKTQVTLIGEELKIRKYETNLGNWIVDQAREAFENQGAQIAFINSGGLRLNQNIPAGTEITRRHIEQIFAYPAPLKLIRITGDDLQKIIEHAVEDWTGNGKWLQISGFAFRHDYDNHSISHLTLLTATVPRLINPEDTLLAVTNTFLFDGGDGYDKYFEPEQAVPNTPSPDLKLLVIKALQEKSSGGEGISPAIEGRICNSQQSSACLALNQ